jgi:hypothetical protein
MMAAGYAKLIAVIFFQETPQPDEPGLSCLIFSTLNGYLVTVCNLPTLGELISITAHDGHYR